MTDPAGPSNSVILVDMGLSMIPNVGGALQTAVSGIRERRQAKAEALVVQLVNEVGVETLVRRIHDNPYVEATFVNAMEAAIRTSHEGKAKLLAAAISQAVLDDAKVDESFLITETLSELDVVHIVALERMAQEARDRDTSSVSAPWGLSPVWSALVAPVQSTLVRTGTARRAESALVSGVGMQEGITPYGKQVLDCLRDGNTVGLRTGKTNSSNTEDGETKTEPPAGM